MAARTFAAFSGSRPAILASISSSVGPAGAGAAARGLLGLGLHGRALTFAAFSEWSSPAILAWISSLGWRPGRGPSRRCGRLRLLGGLGRGDLLRPSRAPPAARGSTTVMGALLRQLVEACRRSRWRCRSMATSNRSWISFSQTKASRYRSVMEGTTSVCFTPLTLKLASMPVLHVGVDEIDAVLGVHREDLHVAPALGMARGRQVVHAWPAAAPRRSAQRSSFLTLPSWQRPGPPTSRRASPTPARPRRR